MQQYTVKPHDSLWKIARQHGTTVDTLAHLNGLQGKRLHDLSIGQKLWLPDASNHPPDTLLTISFQALDFSAFTPKKIEVEHDGKTTQCHLNDQGKLHLNIQDHAQGLKVWIEDLENEFILIMEFPILALGKWEATIDSRMLKLLGNLMPEQGKPETSKEKLKDNTVSQAQQADGQTVQQQTRIEDGEPVHAVATLFTEENLRLSPGNEKYRALLIATAKKHNLTPHALAALIDAEAAKKDGAWDEKSNQSSPAKAQGLCQFFPDAWRDVFKERCSLLCIDCQELSEAEIMLKRLEAKYAIDGAAVYMNLNLQRFTYSTGLVVDKLPAEEKAKIAYLLHHEGVQGVVKLLGLSKTYTEPYSDQAIKEKLIKQLGSAGAAKAESLIKQYEKNVAAAYQGWLFSYTDAKINLHHFIIQDDQKLKKAPKSTAEIIAELTGQPLKKPQPKSQPISFQSSLPTASPVAGTSTLNAPVVTPNVSTSAPAVAHAEWFDPLEVCTLRTAWLSPTGARFGMTRHGGTQAHQGIDLAALPGTPLRAVANGQVSFTPAADINAHYGHVLLLEVGINDLPPAQAAYFRQINPGRTTIGFIYAHISEFAFEKPGKKYFVYAGTIIGKSGCTGNAHGMDTLAKGAHLHFEVRKAVPVGYKGPGLENRVDPLPFIQNCTNR